MACRKRFEKAIEITGSQEKQQAQQRLELERHRVKGRKGPDIGR